MAQRSSGQPADIIAARDKRSFLIDAKVCKDDVFLFSRIEPNQHSAMEIWKLCYGETGWFAVRFGNECVYMISYDTILTAMKNGKKSLSQIDLVNRDYGQTLNLWLLRV